MAVELSMQLDNRRDTAISCVRAAASALANLGVTAVITGSLARNEFGPHSDFDFIITSCPRHLKYAIEGTVEDAVGGLRFDVVYLDELPVWKIDSFTQGAVDSSNLRSHRDEFSEIATEAEGLSNRLSRLDVEGPLVDFQDV
jgi:predicted nucleotidyltransferase